MRNVTRCFFGLNFFRRALFVLLAVASLSSCSTRLVYNYLDWIIPWYVRDYVDLDRDQKSYFKRQLGVILDWHRQEELPKYVIQLRALQRDLREPAMTTEQIEAYAAISMDAWKRVVVRAMPYLGTLTRTFTETQSRQLMSGIQREDRERRTKQAAVSVAERRQQSADRMQRAVEQLTGELQPAQLAMITRWAEDRPSTREQWQAYRAFWQAGLNQTLEQRRSREFVPGFQALLLEQGAYARHPYRQQAWPRSLRYSAEFMSELHASLTPAQRDFLDTKLEKLITDLEQLHNDR